MDAAAKQSLLIAPYGGKLVNLVVCTEEGDDLVHKARLFHLSSFPLVRSVILSS